MRDRLVPCGRYVATLRRSGVVVMQLEGTNFLTAYGEAKVAEIISGSGSITHMGIGTGTGETRSSTDMTTGSATEVARVALTGGYPQQDTGADDNDVLWRATFGASVPVTPETITQGGLFTAISGSNMCNYFEFEPGIPKETSMTLQLDLTWTIGVS